MRLTYGTQRGSKDPQRHHTDFTQGQHNFPIKTIVLVPRKKQPVPTLHRIRLQPTLVAQQKPQHQCRQTNDVHNQLRHTQQWHHHCVPIAVARFLHVRMQISAIADCTAIKNLKRTTDQCGKHQVQYGTHRDHKFVFGGGARFFPLNLDTFIEKGHLFEDTVQVPKAKRQQHHHEWQTCKRGLLVIKKFRCRIRGCDAIGVY